MRCGARRPDSSSASPTATRITKSPGRRPATSWCSPPGFSVPYYIWDPTFKALTDAGFRVLRYDYYGRGFSDRPDVPYTQAFYVRQLAELLDSLKITDSIDLVGLSLGGAHCHQLRGCLSRPRAVAHLCGPVVQDAGVAAASCQHAVAVELLRRLVAERGWADEQLGDFLHPERFPDWPDRYRVQLQYRGFRRARLSELVANASSISARRSSASASTHGRSSSSGGSRILRCPSSRADRSSRRCLARASWRSRTRATCRSGSSRRSHTPPSWTFFTSVK